MLGVGERFHRFREVSGVPATEAALAQLNERLAARGAHPSLASAKVSKLACALTSRTLRHVLRCHQSRSHWSVRLVPLCLQGGRRCLERARLLCDAPSARAASGPLASLSLRTQRVLTVP